MEWKTGKVVGAITVYRCAYIFDDDPEGFYLDFERDGYLIGTTYSGKVERLYDGRQGNYDTITNAKAFRYWEKYFPNRDRDDLPELLQEGLEEPYRHFGTYRDKNGILQYYGG